MGDVRNAYRICYSEKFKEGDHSQESDEALRITLILRVREIGCEIVE